MPRLLLALLLSLTAPTILAQNNIHNAVEEMPELIGGLAALQENIEYPEEARDARIEGRVMVQFVVDEGGNVTNPSILQSAHPALDQAAMDALDNIEFTPGWHEGQPAKVRMILPITFVLPEESRTEGDVAAHVDEMPTIIGGMGAFMELLAYPEDAEAQGLEGRVIITFMVNEEGEVQEAEVAESAHPLLDAAAMDAVRQTRFNPGLKDGEPVRVRMALPVNFELPG